MLQRAIIRSILKDEGHETLEAVDGAKGLETAIAEKPDFMISDLIMPVMDGHALLAALSKEGLKIPVVIVTADIQDGVRQKCLDQGAVDFVNKPVKNDELRGVIQNLVTQKTSKKL